MLSALTTEIESAVRILHLIQAWENADYPRQTDHHLRIIKLWQQTVSTHGAERRSLEAVLIHKRRARLVPVEFLAPRKFVAGFLLSA